MNWLGSLSIQQLMHLIQRYDVKPYYKNPQKRGKAMKKAIRSHWKKHPEECPICFEPISFAHCSMTPCTHFFCDRCLIPHLSQKETCPLCRHPCSYIDMLTQISWKKLLKLILQKNAKETRIVIEPDPISEPIAEDVSYSLDLMTQFYLFSTSVFILFVIGIYIISIWTFFTLATQTLLSVNLYAIFGLLGRRFLPFVFHSVE